MIKVSRTVELPDGEVELSAIRAQGAGGQHVNKTSTAIHLRFDIAASSLPPFYKQRMLAAKHHLITPEGMVIIKAQEYRSQEMNREANTILSKANNIEISDVGINLKTGIEKIREQIQNIE